MKRKLLVAPVVAVACFTGAAFAQDPNAPAGDAGAAPADTSAAPADAAPAADSAAPSGEAAPASDESSSSSKLPSTSYLGFMGGYLFQDTKLFTDHTRKSSGLTGDNGGSFQVFYGQHGASGLGWEFTLFGDIIETGKNKGTDFYRPGVGLDLVYSFGDRIGFTPFILVGGGGVYDDQYPDNFDKFAPYGNFGAGFVTGDLGKGVHLRGEGRYVYDN
ncbi:MAG TPA: hypothetical protein VFB36_06555, partial [Nevskiaceae bacterium]|nr:hypothetical protein [Nevskiaceae bacterium]